MSNNIDNNNNNNNNDFSDAMETSVYIPNILLTRGHNLRFCQLPVRINSFSKSFFPDSIKIWNQLPISLVNCSDFIIKTS